MAHIGWWLLTAAMLGVCATLAIRSMDRRCDLLWRAGCALVLWCAAHAMAAAAAADAALWILDVPAPSSLVSALLRTVARWSLVLAGLRLIDHEGWRLWSFYPLVALGRRVRRILRRHPPNQASWEQRICCQRLACPVARP